MSNTKLCLLLLMIAGAFSCRFQRNSDRLAPENTGAGAFQLRLAPVPGSKYLYSISNHSDLNFQADDKKFDNESKMDAAVEYIINKDSSGDFSFHIRYDKLHIYSKNGDAESDLDAANAAGSTDPVEQLLGSLKNADIIATISPGGEVRSVTGFKELHDKFMAQFAAVNSYQVEAIKKRWENIVGDQMIHKDMEQMFRIFPDSAVHIGDKWKLSSKQKGEISLYTANSFTLTDIHDQTAFIESDGQITSDSLTNFMGMEVTTDLKGQQKGEFELETKTGMLKRAKVTVDVKGTFQVMGREIPLTIETNFTIDRISSAL